MFLEMYSAKTYSYQVSTLAYAVMVGHQCDHHLESHYMVLHLYSTVAITSLIITSDESAIMGLVSQQ